MNNITSSINKKAAQLFIAAVPFTNDDSELFRTVEKYIEIGVGGLMLGIGGRLPYIETNGVTDIGKLKKLTEKLKSLDPKLFLAVDSEGGDIFNLLKNVSPLKSAREYGLDFERAGSTKQFEKDLDNHIEIMKEAGINMNFVPVLDVAKDGYKGYMSEHKRAYSNKNETVKKLSGIVIEKMRENKIIAVGKHFPGYGHIDKDPHIHLSELADDDELSSFDFAVSEHNISAIMKGHVLSELDTDMPATISEKTEKYLREELGFTGLSMTDQIFMNSLNEYYDQNGGDQENKKRAVDAVKTNDIILMSYPKGVDGKINIDAHNHFPRLHEAVRKAVKTGEISEEKIDTSYDRVVKHKKKIGLCLQL